MLQQNFTFRNKFCKRINKRQARNIFNHRQGEILFNPVNMKCRGFYSQLVVIEPLDERYINRDFDSVCNEFEYYNCNSQTGKYAAFYISV